MKTDLGKALATAVVWLAPALGVWASGSADAVPAFGFSLVATFFIWG